MKAYQQKSEQQIWYEQVKKDLLKTEPQNIFARSVCCQRIVNDEMSQINSGLGLAAIADVQQYVCEVRPCEHLQFLASWPGLRVDNSPKAPKTKKEYEKKSKNWLNGRRAPNYGKTLFPFFVESVESYVANVAKLLMGGHAAKEQLYFNICIYRVLAELCACTVALHEQAKKAPFFCKNSLERKGRLKELLQSYAADHEYTKAFPSCFEEAFGYFDRKSKAFRRMYCSEYMHTNLCVADNRSCAVEVIEPEKKYNIEQDATYWRNKCINADNENNRLRAELSQEREMRAQADQERARLKEFASSSIPTLLPFINHSNTNSNSSTSNAISSSQPALQVNDSFSSHTTCGFVDEHRNIGNPPLPRSFGPADSPALSILPPINSLIPAPNILPFMTHVPFPVSVLSTSASNNHVALPHASWQQPNYSLHNPASVCQSSAPAPDRFDAPAMGNFPITHTMPIFNQRNLLSDDSFPFLNSFQSQNFL